MILTLCCLLLIAYLFDLTSSKTKIPSVILLLLVGWGLRKTLELFGIQVPGLVSLLPFFGTIGLILIVLEGALELEINRSKTAVIKKSFLIAITSTVGLALVLALIFQQYNQASFKDNLINMIPFCVISSAIAIPSARNLSKANREFIIYESSMSDIIGILLFNFLLMNEVISASSFAYFSFQLVLITLISFISAIGLAFLLSRIDHHIKFVPILLLVILIYEISKIYHLPALLFIVSFGLFIGNLDELKRFKLVQKLKPDALNTEVHKFKDILTEGTFLIRSLFFLLFGYFIKRDELLNGETVVWSLSIVTLIFLIRAIQLRIARLPLRPLLFVAPRGLITILLFLSIGASKSIEMVNESLIIQVVVFTALIMMIGLMLSEKPKKQLAN